MICSFDRNSYEGSIFDVLQRYLPLIIFNFKNHISHGIVYGHRHAVVLATLADIAVEKMHFCNMYNRVKSKSTLKLFSEEADNKRKIEEDAMKKFFPIFALFLIIAGCSTAPGPSEEPSTDPLNVRETWSGYSKGPGGECPNCEVEFKILEDFSIIGTAYSRKYDLTIRLKGKLTYDGELQASGTGSGFNVKYNGKVLSESASGRWSSSWPQCYGTWELAKN